MTPEQFSQWRKQPETQEFFDYLWRLRLIAMEDWAHRAFMGNTPDQSNRRNDHAIGQVECMTKLLTVKFEDIQKAFEETGGLNEFRYPARREDNDSKGGGVDAAGEGGPGSHQTGPY
jgi:hypothetical protein